MAQSPRELALSVLTRWENLADPPHIPDRTDAHWAPLLPRDRNFAFDLITGVLRTRGLLDAIIASQLTGSLASLETKVHAILWIGAYQLLLHESGRAYATVDTSVELAKRAGVARSAGLINAVLRAITRLKPAVEVRHGLSAATFPLNFTHQIRLERPIFPVPSKDLRAHLAAITSHPRPLVDMLVAAHGETLATNIMIRNNLRPLILLRRDDPSFSPLPETGLLPHENPRFFYVSHGWNPEIEKLVAAGRLSPQDPTSAKPVEMLVQQCAARNFAPASILDLCAGLGTKSVQLARAFPKAHITAADIDAQKLSRLIARAAEMRISNVTTTPLANLPVGTTLTGAFDVVLVDVPCSNTGVMARRVQSRWRWPQLDRNTLRQTQLELLVQAAGLVTPGGLVIYATCAIDPAENRQLIDAFLAQSSRPLKLLSDELTLPAITDDPAQQHDGGYMALLSA